MFPPEQIAEVKAIACELPAVRALDLYQRVFEGRRLRARIDRHEPQLAPAA